MLEEKGGQKTILFLKSLLCINEKKLLCQRGQTGSSELTDLSLPYFAVFYFGFWFYIMQNMYAAVASFKSFVRGVPLVTIILFMQFQRQAYRCVRSGTHILNTILFELVVDFT